MRAAPTDLTADQVGAAVAAHWPIHPAEVRHAAVGFGSHHWTLSDRDGRRWFLSGDAVADVPAELERLSAAIHTAYALRHRSGLSFVVAPVPGTDGRLLTVRGRYAIAVYPYLEQVSERPLEPDESVGMMAALHGAVPQPVSIAPVDDLLIEHRAVLEAVLAVPAAVPGRGPYAQSFVDLVTAFAAPIRAALDRYDALVEIVGGSRDSWVITHGEAKRDNVVITSDGPMLIDWDTVRIGPAARDLWMAGSVRRYVEVTGRSVPDDHLLCYRLRWDLADLCSFGAWFTGDHLRTADTELGWQSCLLITRRLDREFGRPAARGPRRPAG